MNKLKLQPQSCYFVCYTKTMVDELIYSTQDERIQHRHNGKGWIEVVVGSMYSGKSEELIRRLKRAKIARQKVQVFKPKIDDRYSKEEIASHSGIKFRSKPVSNSTELMSEVKHDTEVIGIDEGQFFDGGLVGVANDLANQGKRIIIAGLDQDFMGRPFEPMPQLLAIAEFITKTHAICVRCGDTASYSQRTFESEERVAVGASGMYEARCRQCFVPHSDKPTNS